MNHTEQNRIVNFIWNIADDDENKYFHLKYSYNKKVYSKIIRQIILLTINKIIQEVPYKKYIEAIKTNKIALKVKLADLEDNMDIKRIAHPKFRDYARLAEYLKYYNELKVWE